MKFLAERFSNSERWLRLSDPASDCSDSDFVRAAREVWDRHKGRPAQAVDVTSGGAPLTIRIVRDDPDPE